jgi:RNA polymerase sigma-70 factor (ECF subfamily)
MTLAIDGGSDVLAAVGGAAQRLESAAAEADLVARLRRGDQVAYEQLVRSEGRHLLAVARRLLRNDEDAQDAVQQAVLSAFRALPSFTGGSRLATWLHRIVTNAALMKLRTRGRRPEESIEDLLPRYVEDGHHVEQFSDWTILADALMVRQELRTQVREAIDRLPDSYRTVLLLREIEELSTEEAARALGVTINTVKIRLHRARQALVKLLGPAMQGAARPTRRPVERTKPSLSNAGARLG